MEDTTTAPSRIALPDITNNYTTSAFGHVILEGLKIVKLSCRLLEQRRCQLLDLTRHRQNLQKYCRNMLLADAHIFRVFVDRSAFAAPPAM